MIHDPISVLLFEDNPGDARLIEELLINTQPTRFSLSHVETLKFGLHELSNKKHDLVLLDLGLPDSEGLISLTNILVTSPHIPIIVLTGLNDSETAFKAIEAGAQDYLIKGEFTKDLLIRAIGYAINRKNTENELKESEERFRTIIENSDSGYFCINKEGYLRNANSAWAKLYGYSSVNEVICRHYTEIEKIDDLNKAELLFNGILAGDKLFMSGEISRRCKDGTLGYHTYSARAVSRNGETTGIEGFIIDTTARRKAENIIHNLNQELENRVSERTEQLNMVNQELEAFSYSVSHDLRAPLRAIDGYSSVLMSDYAKQLDDVGREYLEYICSAAKQMNYLIDDLIDLAHVTRVELCKTEINLSNIVFNLAAELEEKSEERVIIWNIAPNLNGFGDERLLEVALTNLINNAYKFTSQIINPKIEFGAQSENGKITYYLKDNGAGYDMKDASKLFEPFHRLPSAKMFEGTGIGLTIVQRIINRHGGKIWAEGELDKGATFFFTLD